MDGVTETAFKARAKLALEKEFGGELILAFNGKQDAMGLRLDITLTDLDPAAARAKLVAEWERWAPSFGLDIYDLERKCIYAGKAWTIIGIQPTKRRAPLRAQDAEGKMMMFGPSYLEPAKPKPKPAPIAPKAIATSFEEELGLDDLDEKPAKAVSTFKMPEPLTPEELLSLETPYGEEMVVVEAGDDMSW